VRFLLLFSVR